MLASNVKSRSICDAKTFLAHNKCAQIGRPQETLARSKSLLAAAAPSNHSLLHQRPAAAPSGHRQLRRRGSPLRSVVCRSPSSQIAASSPTILSVATPLWCFHLSRSIQSSRRTRFSPLNMRIVGLTGGIASGKSTVSDLFRSSGVPVVDADLVARDVVKKGTPGWRKVAAAFGGDVLLENGEINRSLLGQIVFSDAAKRQLLNRLLAPHISSGIFWEIIKLWVKGCKVIVLDIPLLFEVKMDRRTKPIIVVWVSPETQLQRLMARDGISEEEARNKINAQTSLDWKKTKADIVIDNSSSIEDTRTQFQKVLKQVTTSFSWKEFALSRESMAVVLVSLFIGSWILLRRI